MEPVTNSFVMTSIATILATLGLSQVTTLPTFAVWLIVICVSAFCYNMSMPKDKRRNPFMVISLGLGVGIILFNSKWEDIPVLEHFNIYLIAAVVGIGSCLIKEIILTLLDVLKKVGGKIK